MTEETPIAEPDARTLRFLKGLVTVLTATMILGLGAIVVMLMIRLQAPATPAHPPLPETITLPQGTTATAFTQGAAWYAVVTADERILIYSRETGALIQDIVIETGQ